MEKLSHAHIAITSIKTSLDFRVVAAFFLLPLPNRKKTSHIDCNSMQLNMSGRTAYVVQAKSRKSVYPMQGIRIQTNNNYKNYPILTNFKETIEIKKNTQPTTNWFCISAVFIRGHTATIHTTQSKTG